MLATEKPVREQGFSQLARWAAGSAALVCCWIAAPGVAMAVPPAVQAVRVIECGGDDEFRPTVVTGVTISPDGRTVAAANDDHLVRIWDAESGTLRGQFSGHRDWVRTVALSSDGLTLASGANDRVVCLWDVASGECRLELPEMESAVAAVSFHPNDQQLAVVGFGDTLTIVNTSSGQVTQQLDCPSADLRAVAFSPDGERMAVAGRNGQIRLWNVVSGVLERDIDTGRQRIRALAFSPNGLRLAAAGDGVTIYILDVLSGNQVVTLPARPAKIYAATFITDHSLATGGSDNKIRIWDLDTRNVTKELVGHTGSVAALAVDRAGATLVSGSYDTTLRIWSLVDSGALPSVAHSLGDVVR